MERRRARVARLHILGTYSGSQISEMCFPDTLTRKRSTLMIRSLELLQLVIGDPDFIIAPALCNKQADPAHTGTVLGWAEPNNGRTRGDIAMNVAPVLCVVLAYARKMKLTTPRCAMRPDRRSAVAQNSSARVAQATDLQTKNCSPSGFDQQVVLRCLEPQAVPRASPPLASIYTPPTKPSMM